MVRAHRAFTLVELLIVIVVIGVIAALAVPKVANRTLKAREARLKNDLQSLRCAVDRFRQETGVWPADLPHLQRRTAPATCLSDTNPPRIVGWPAGMPWGGPYFNQAHGSGLGNYEYGIDTISGRNYATIKIDNDNRASDGTRYSDW